MIHPDLEISSPFKFLNSYQKNDINSYFGRDEESHNIFELYKDSSIMILHGPSGSGKTSLIYCGLLNKIRKDKTVISIRRDDNLIHAIGKRLFVTPKANGADVDDQSPLLETLFISYEKLDDILVKIKHKEQMMLDIEEEIIQLKRERRKSTVSQSEVSSDQEKDTLNLKIEKHELILKKLIDERKQKLETLKERNQQVIDISNEIVEYFKTRNLYSTFTPLVIFDQFEELFVYGNKDEIDKFGLFLKLVFDHRIPFNIAISLREEYFGHLDQLQSYVPYIFYKKLRLAHPDRDTIKNIIERSFEKFNINQFKGQTSVELQPDEKKERIELILEQIKIQDNGATSYHLPFLQVYLDSLYKIDYLRTYQSNPTKEDCKKLLPLEFKVEEIKEFGSIENVLENYIREVNTRIISNTNNTLNDSRQHKDSVIKLLRHLITKDDLKKRVSIRQENEIYIITNDKIMTQIHNDIWGDVDDKNNETISEIIEELRVMGILNVSGDYIELSHDIIAKVINNIGTEEDFRSLIRTDFNSSFDIYQKTMRREDLLNEQQIARVLQCKEYVINDTNENQSKLKREFIYNSELVIKEEQLREEREKKEQQTWMQGIRDKERLILRKYSRAIVLILIISVIGFWYLYRSIKQKSAIQGELYSELATEMDQNQKTSEVYKLLSGAFKDYEIDKTRSFNKLMQAEKMISKEQNSLNQSDFNLLYDFKNRFYKSYIKTPLYFNSINLDAGYITSTKTRKSLKDSTLVNLFALTSSKKLIVHSLRYATRNAAQKLMFDKENVLAFEPFYIHKELYTLIATKNTSDKVAIQLIDKEGLTLQEIGLNGITLLDIEYQKIVEEKEQNLYSFLIGIDNKIQRISLKNSEDQISFENTTLIDTLDDQIRRIRTFPNNKQHYLALYGDHKMYLKDQAIDANILNTIIAKDEYIHSFKFLNENEILLGLNEGIERVDLTNYNNHQYLDFRHNESISSIEVGREKILVSSFDKTASLWSTKDKKWKLLKQFIGHEDAILNVSFLTDEEDYLITSGEDQAIKIWNIDPIAETLNDSVAAQFKILNKDDDVVYQTVYSEDTDEQVFTNKFNDNISIPTRSAIYLIKQDIGKNILIFISSDNTIYLYRDHVLEDSFSGHTDKIKDIDFSESGKYMVSGSLDNKAIIWKLNSQKKYKPAQVLTSHTGDIVDVEFHADSLLLTASSDNTVQIYKRRKDDIRFKQIPSLIYHDYGIISASFSSDGKHIIAIDKKGIVKKWEIDNFDSILDARTYETP